MHILQFNTACKLYDRQGYVKYLYCSTQGWKVIINQSLGTVPSLSSIMITDETTNKDESKSKIVLEQRQQLCHQITCISTRTTIISKIENIVPINIICSSNVSFSYPLKFLIIFKAMMSYVTRDDCSGQVSICVHKQVNDWLPMDRCMEM